MSMMLSRKKVLKAHGQAKGKYNRAWDAIVARLSGNQLAKLAKLRKKYGIEFYEVRDVEIVKITTDSRTLALFGEMKEAFKQYTLYDTALKTRTI